MNSTEQSKRVATILPHPRIAWLKDRVACAFPPSPPLFHSTPSPANSGALVLQLGPWSPSFVPVVLSRSDTVLARSDQWQGKRGALLRRRASEADADADGRLGSAGVTDIPGPTARRMQRRSGPDQAIAAGQAECASVCECV